MIDRPKSSEYAPFYSGYIDAVPVGNIFQTLEFQLDETLSLFQNITEDQSMLKYSEDKWTIKEVLGHIVDSEWIFSNRALRFSRSDQAELPGFDQDEYIYNANFNKLSIKSILDQFYHLRKANLLLFKSFSKDQTLNIGIANKNIISVRAIIYITSGHQKHHIDVLKERYLPLL